MGLLRIATLLAGIAAAPALIKAPAPIPAEPGRPGTVDEVIDAARVSRLTGWELVDHATALVHERYTHYSAWHLWESPHESFRNGRGTANQYNSALAEVLSALGFEVHRVQAARVRMDRAPWWQSGHTWVRVAIEGRERDVCAGRADNRAGHVGFTPVTPVRPFSDLSYATTTLALVPFTLEAIWRSIATRTAPPRWLYRRFGEPVER